ALPIYQPCPLLPGLRRDQRVRNTQPLQQSFNNAGGMPEGEHAGYALARHGANLPKVCVTVSRDVLAKKRTDCRTVYPALGANLDRGHQQMGNVSALAVHNRQRPATTWVNPDFH